MKLRDLERIGLKIRRNWWRVVFVALILVLIWVGYERLVTLYGRVVLTIVALILVLIWVVYERPATRRWPDWTGFGGYISPTVQPNQTFQRGKTLWDLMQLLIIPAVLAGAAYWLNESARQSEQAIAEDNIREAALQTYIDRMAELLIKENLSEPKNGSEVREVARARTLTVLPRLDKERKGALLQFLYEADLIQKDKRVIYLRDADLSGIKLVGADLSGTDLSYIHLDGADLRFTKLSGADLSYANLPYTDLRYALLDGADMFRVNLNGADLSWAKLRWVNLSGAGLIGADLSGADLSGADLSYANLSGADLSYANLNEADLSYANLNETDLSKVTYTKNTPKPAGFGTPAPAPGFEASIVVAVIALLVIWKKR